MKLQRDPTTTRNSNEQVDISVMTTSLLFKRVFQQVQLESVPSIHIRDEGGSTTRMESTDSIAEMETKELAAKKESTDSITELIQTKRLTSILFIAMRS